MTNEELEKQMVELRAMFDAANKPKPALTQVDGEHAQRKMRFAVNELNAPMSALTSEHYALGALIFSHRVKQGIDRTMPARIEAALRTMTTGGATTGAELVESIQLPTLWQDVLLASKVASLFQNVPMGAKTVDLPLGLGGVTFYKPAGEGQAVTATDLATAKATLTAYDLKAQVDVSDDMDEDSIIALLPAIRERLVLDGGDCIDEAALCADATSGTGNINCNGASIAASSRFLIGFDGLLHLPLIDNTGMAVSTATLADSSFSALMKLLGKYAVDPERVAFVCDIWTYFTAIVLANVLTVDKFGTGATILRGQLGSIFGVPIVVSGALAKADSGGKIDGVTPANNDAGRLICVNRDMTKIGIRQPIRIATERSESKGMTSVVITLRMAEACYGTRASATHTALNYHITV